MAVKPADTTYWASGPAIEVSTRGHTVKIVRGDHPAVRPYVLRTSYRNGQIPSVVLERMTPEARVAYCSCGATVCWYSAGSAAYNARQAEKQANQHVKRSTRPPRFDVKWTRADGWVPKNAAEDPIIPAEWIERSTDVNLERLYSRREELDRQIERLESLPPEPRLDIVGEIGTEPCVVWFTKTFGRTYDSAYTYAAVLAGDGLWYTTGPSAPKGYSWNELIEWIYRDEPDGDAEVWLGTDWERL